MSIRQWPQRERPREKLLERGPGILTEAELLAILLRTGVFPGNNPVGGTIVPAAVSGCVIGFFALTVVNPIIVQDVFDGDSRHLCVTKQHTHK